MGKLKRKFKRFIKGKWPLLAAIPFAFASYNTMCPIKDSILFHNLHQYELRHGEWGRGPEHDPSLGEILETFHDDWLPEILVSNYGVAIGGLTLVNLLLKKDSKKKKSNDSDENDESEKAIDITKTKTGSIIDAVQNNSEISEIREKIYQYHQHRIEVEHSGRMAKKIPGILFFPFIAGYHLIAPELVPEKKKERYLLRNIYEDWEDGNYSTLFKFNEIYWKKLHKVNPDKTYYLLEALYLTQKHYGKQTKTKRAWNSFIDEYFPEGIENAEFNHAPRSRNEVLEFSIDDKFKVYIKRSDDHENINNEFKNTLLFYEATEHAPVPGTVVQGKDGKSYLLIVSAGERTLYDIFDQSPRNKDRLDLEERLERLDIATEQLEDIHSEGRERRFKNALKDRSFYSKRNESVCDSLGIDDELKENIIHGLRPIEEQICNLLEECSDQITGYKVFKKILTQYHKDPNTKNITEADVDGDLKIEHIDYESMRTEASLSDYIALWEFPRNNVPLDIRNQRIMRSIRRTSRKQKIMVPEYKEKDIYEKIEESLDFARILTHWKYIEYRHRDKETAYKFYHKKQVDDALQRLVQKGHRELIPLQDAMDELHDHALEYLA
ncbi:MAG: hypothetical protein ACLFPQ_01370 [Candidatus Woesearchaeota archaeon]